MSLPDFIHDSLDEILAAWERAGAPEEATAGASGAARREHFGRLLRAVADETRRVRATAPARGEQGAGVGANDSAASRRFAEYATLRATVLRQWRAKHPAPSADELDDIVHFNEAMDRSLAELAATFTPAEDDGQALFLGVFNHELRTSVSSIQLAAQVLLHRAAAGSPEQKAAQRIARSCESVRLNLDALSDFTQVRLGKHLPIDPKPDDFGVLCRQAVDAFAAAQPGRRVVLRSTGDLLGEWDDARIREAVAALVAHAARFSPSISTITVTASGEVAVEVRVAVHGIGTPIEGEALRTIFDANARSATDHATYAGLGLGLFIVRKIVDAHLGRVEIDLDDQRGTTLTIVLPRWT